MSKQKKILFIGFDASRTGAPIILLDIAKNIKESGGYITDFLFDSCGDLVPDYQLLGEVNIVNIPLIKYSIIKRIFNKIKSQIFGTPKELIFRNIIKKKYDIIYINTVAAIPLFLTLKINLTDKTICHVHELEMAIQIFCRNGEIEKADKYIDKYIAVSESVKLNLIKNHAIINSKIDIIHGYSSIGKSSISKKEILNQLKIPENKYIVGCVGRADLRKGFDFFISIANMLILKNSNIVFIWIGSIPEENKIIIFETIKVLNLREGIIFTGSINNPESYYQLFDIFLHTSREDPFPLSILEAAQNGLPIISFEGSGGSAEFIEKTGSGLLVPYMDCFQMAERIIELKNNIDLYNKLKENALNADKIFNKENSKEQIKQILKN